MVILIVFNRVLRRFLCIQMYYNSSEKLVNHDIRSFSEMLRKYIFKYTGSVSASVSVYSNDYTLAGGGGGGEVKKL